MYILLLSLWHSVNLSDIFTVARPEISSINGASILINFCSVGFKIIFPFGNRCIDLFKKAKATFL